MFPFLDSLSDSEADSVLSEISLSELLDFLDFSLGLETVFSDSPEAAFCEVCATDVDVDTEVEL